MNMSLKTLFVLCLFFSPIWAQFYEDRRCRCICPSLASVLNNSQSLDRRFYTDNVPPSKCNCDGVIIPKVGSEIKGHEQEFCPRCECKYETRNTTVIMVVVIMVLWVLTLLSGYMGFMICLDPLINKQRVKFYQERGTEEARNLLLQGDDLED
ncbi:hypothetical protein K1T71_000449 [Dendrolimus kikuchii]|uniref:Uncharacterized protein n=1 Tax=Dendrolimus kikuchii TaxID=765133 RepID=A0ACC1DJL4_9NEOP|nr:hypothetical protein K1T71_000449 [Dendrolimus kikuchii]